MGAGSKKHMYSDLRLIAFLILNAMLTLPAQADTTRLTIEGTVTSTTCSAEVAGVSVSFGSVSGWRLLNNGVSEPVPFSIQLNSCFVEGNGAEALFMFNGKTLGNNAYLELNDGAGVAENVVIAVTDPQGRSIFFDNQTEYNYPLQNGSNSFDFTAVLVATDARSRNRINGKVDATATFVVTYN